MPVAPSARNHSLAGAVTPALPWPPQNGSTELKYIDRSAMIGTPLVEVNCAETSASASSAMSLST